MPHPSPVYSSLWLLARDADQQLFTGIVDRLAHRYATPRFQPHMTLLGDLKIAPGDLDAAADRIARAAPPFTLPCRDVVSGTAFFRSFYALFEVGPELALLRAAAEAAIAPATEPFMPHVSLAYGTIAEPDKSAGIAEMRSVLKDRPFTFDRLVVTNSGGDTAIADWRITRTVPLGLR